MPTFDSQLRAAVKAEVTRALAPHAANVQQLTSREADLRALVGRLGVALAPLRARRRAVRVQASPPAKAPPGAPGPKPRCAVKGCRKARGVLGYCPSHYQKRRNLLKTHRLPEDWKADAPPHSARDVTLPRGLAGAKALAAAKQKAVGAKR